MEIAQIKLASGLLLVDEYPVTVAEATPAGIRKTKEEIDYEKKHKLIRVGKVLSSCELSSTTVIIGKNEYKEGELVGKDVMYYANRVDAVIDISIKEVVRPLLLNTYSILAIIEEE